MQGRCRKRLRNTKGRQSASPAGLCARTIHFCGHSSAGSWSSMVGFISLGQYLCLPFHTSHAINTKSSRMMINNAITFPSIPTPVLGIAARRLPPCNNEPAWLPGVLPGALPADAPGALSAGPDELSAGATAVQWANNVVLHAKLTMSPGLTRMPPWSCVYQPLNI